MRLIRKYLVDYNAINKHRQTIEYTTKRLIDV